MDPITIAVILLVLAETGSGGFLTANVAGGVAGAGSAFGRSVAGAAKDSYAKRAERLQKTAIGRWRLWSEAKIGNGALRLQAGAAGLIRGGARGVVAGAKGVPGGAAKGRQVRRQAIGGARERAKSGAANVASVATAAKDRLVRAPGQRCTWETGYHSPVRLVCGRPVVPNHDVCEEHLEALQDLVPGPYEDPAANRNGWTRRQAKERRTSPNSGSAVPADLDTAPVVHGGGQWRCPGCGYPMKDLGEGRYECPNYCGISVEPKPGSSVAQPPCRYCGNAIVNGVCSNCGQDPTRPFVGEGPDPCRCCGGNHGRQMTGGEHCSGCDRHGTDARFPETPEQVARRHVREQLERDAAAKAQQGDGVDDEPEPTSDDLAVMQREHEEAISAARTGRCVWHIQDQGHDGPTVLCGQKVRDGYIFCGQHLDQIEEGGRSPHDFMFHMQDVEDEHLDPRQDVPERTRDQAEILRQFDPQTSPVPSGSEKEDQMSTNTSDVAEDKGSIPYVQAWDGETGIAERLVSDLTEIADRMAKAIEANARHDIGGGQDVVGKWRNAISVVQDAGEATDGYSAALHQAWDATNENLRGHAASSAQDLAGAH